MATLVAAKSASGAREGSTTLLLIALFKLLKGVALLAIAIGAVRLLHRDIAEAVTRWIEFFRVDPDNRLIHTFFSRVTRITPEQLKALSLGTFVYAALLLTEGTGLLLRKGWAEYFTIITTAGLIPLEVYELTRHVSVGKIIVLIINVAIVVYLILRVRSRSHEMKNQSA